MEQTEIFIKSTMDKTLQPSLFYAAEGKEKRPLLVGLHTWSCDRFNQVDRLVPVAKKYNFNLILPEFRGPNLVENPNCFSACGSELAKQDIKDAIDYAVSERNIDADNIFLFGESGGGHMALLMAGYCPEYFKVIASFVPITDLKKWEEESDEYREHILACCNGDETEMEKRSPKSYIDNIAKANVKIFHGKYDNSVPVTHSISLFNMIMEKHPHSKVYLDIFDGGHQTDMTLAMHWIMSQYKDNKNMDVTK